MSNNPNSVVVWGGGANQPLINSLNTLNTLKNSNSKELAKNLNKIQSSNLSKESNSKIQDSIKLESIKDSNSIQSKQSKTTITKIGISIVASIVLSQSLVALPSGGKFTSGNGSITTSDKVMNITGNNKNHIIAWGGGFNINKGESVNFNTSHKQQASFLNLDYSNKASQILGNLNGNGNNIYLVNPSGVLIGQNASINANKFVASNIIDDTTLNSFKTQTKLVESFSPVFKPNKGNIVNLGSIRAKEIVLIGNEVGLSSGVIGNKEKGGSITLVGNEVVIDADKTKIQSDGNLVITAMSGGMIQGSVATLKNNGYKFGDYNSLVFQDYIDSSGNTYKHNAYDRDTQKGFLTLATIGGSNDNNQRVQEWNDFASGLGYGDMQLVDEFRLLNDIDFSGKDITQAWSIKGSQGPVFTQFLNGNNHTLSNIDFTNVGFVGNGVSISYMGIFSYLYGAKISNLTLDNITMKVTRSDTPEYNLYIGILAGRAYNTQFENIKLNNIALDITSQTGTSGQNFVYAGGLVGYLHNSNVNAIGGSNININIKNKNAYTLGGGIIGAMYGSTIVNGNFSNITIEAKTNMDGAGFAASYVGGLAGMFGNGDGGISNFIIDSVKVVSQNVDNNGQKVDSSSEIYTGGALGRIGTGNINFKNILFKNISVVSLSENYDSNSYHYTGGFAGGGSPEDSEISFTNITLNDIKEVSALTETYTYGAGPKVGGFMGFGSSNGLYKNIALNNVEGLKVQAITDAMLGGLFGQYYASRGIENAVINGLGNMEMQLERNTSNTGYAGLIAGRGSPENLKNIDVLLKDGFSFNIKTNSEAITLDAAYLMANGVAPKNVENINVYGRVNFDIQGSKGEIKKDLEDEKYKGKDFNVYDTKDFSTAQEELNKRGDLFQTSGTFGQYYSFFDKDLLSKEIDKSFQYTPVDALPPLSESDIGDVSLSQDDFNQSILDSILGKDNQGNSNLIFDLLTQDLESIRQSLDFLVSFLDGENDIKELFGDYYKVNDNIYGALNQDLTINLKFSNFIEALKQNKDINLAFLKDYRDKLNTYNQNKELYQSGGLPSLEQESLKKLLEEQYNELLNLEQTAKTNLESLQGLIKDSFKTDTNYTIFAKESLSPLNFTINIGSLNNFEDTQGNGDNNNRFTPPNEVQKIADLASKEAILILPAQEKQEAIVEDGKERGRLCIVSDNAKTNNPCMAITY